MVTASTAFTCLILTDLVVEVVEVMFIAIS